MKNDRDNLDPLLLELPKEGLREMETGCRGCNRSKDPGIDRLVGLLVFVRGIPFYVMRERRDPYPLDDLKEIALMVEPDRAPSGGGVVDHLAPELAVVEKDLVPDSYLSGRIDNDVPDVLFCIQFTQEEHLDLGIGLLFLPKEPRLKDTRLIHHEAITFAKIVHDIKELAILHGFVSPVHDKHGRMVARLGRILGNEIPGQRISEV